MSQDEHSTPPRALDEDDAEAERFFAAGEAAPGDIESLAPTVGDDNEWELPRLSPLTEAQLQRRARLRRFVGLGLGGGVAILVTGIGAARLGSPLRALAPRAVTTPGAPALASVAPIEKVATPTPRPAASASAPEPPTAATASALELLTKARSLLQAGRAREGVAVAREAVAADSGLPEAYVLLAAGLEDLGRWSDAHRTFTACAERTRSTECSYFARKPR